MSDGETSQANEGTKDIETIRPGPSTKSLMQGIPIGYRPEGDAWVVWNVFGPRRKLRYDADPSRVLLGHNLPVEGGLSTNSLRIMAKAREKEFRDNNVKPGGQIGPRGSSEE